MSDTSFWRRARALGGLAALAVTTVLVTGSVSSCMAQEGGSAAGSESVDSAEVARRLGGGGDWKTDFSRISVPPGEIVSGGPPKDGIPSIDEPEFVSPEEADSWLEGPEPVMVVRMGGETKAYPLRILMQHEIVNDRVGGEPVAVTFCPLCNTALVFDRRVQGRVLDFGTTGRLRRSDLVMYDRQTESWWQQATGRAIVGDFVGTELEFLPSNTFSWAKAKELHPDLRVLSRDTGYDRDYGRNPYVGYDRRSGPIRGFFPSSVQADRRLPAMQRVVGVKRGQGWAVAFSALREVRVVNATVDGEELAVFWLPGKASALDRSRVAAGRDVGQTAVYLRTLDDRTLTFKWTGDAFRDDETGSTWNLAGRATSGPLEGRQLEPVPHGDYFWFAWTGFRPDAELWKLPELED